MKFVDVREPLEYMLGHVSGAVNIPLGKLESDFDKSAQDLESNDEIVLYCRSGNRAGIAAELFTQHGFTYVVNGINREHVERTYL